LSLSSKVGSFNTGVGIIGSTVVVAGLGFTPKVLILWWSGRTEAVDTIGRASLFRGIGFADGATARCSVGNSIDAQAAGDSSRGMQATPTIIATLDAAGAFDGLIDWTSFDADGFTLTVADVMPLDLRVHYLALGGLDITDVDTGIITEAAATGNQATTGVGFQPDLVLFSSGNEAGTLPQSASTGGVLMFGAAKSSTSRYVWCAGTDEASATMDSSSYCIDDGCIALMPNAIGDVIDARADFVSMDADGFTVNWLERAALRRVLYLAIKGGSYLLGDLLTQTDITTSIVESGFGFSPTSVMFVSHCQTKSTSDTGQAHDRMSIGAFSDATTRGAQATLDEDAVLDSEVTTAIEFDGVYVNISLTSTIDGEMDVVSVDSDGFTCIMDNADPAQAFVWYIALGSTVVPPVPPPTPSTVTIAPSIRPSSRVGAGSYEIWLTSDTGSRLAHLTTITTLTASRVVNGVGWFALKLPLSFDINMIGVDRMVQIWRQPRGGVMSLWRPYFLRKWVFSTEGSREVVTLEGPCINDVLRRRIVAAYSGTAQASKTDFADDMMKEVVTQSIADGVAPLPAAGTRVWSNLSIQADASAGPTITKTFPFDTLLTSSGNGVLAVLAQAAREAGTEVFFSIEPNVVTGSSLTLQFQTKVNQPGQDVTSFVVFDQARGNMREPSLEYDYSEEENYIYAAGQGEGAARNIQQVSDSTRYSASIWNRCEGFADARNQTADNGVIAAGNSALEQERPRIRFTAIPVDTAGTRFGIDWNFGDKVRSRYKNVEFDTIIRAVTISLDGNRRETIQARLDFEGLVT